MYAFCVCKINISFFYHEIYNNLITKKAVSNMFKVEKNNLKSENILLISSIKNMNHDGRFAERTYTPPVRSRQMKQ